MDRYRDQARSMMQPEQPMGAPGMGFMDYIRQHNPAFIETLKQLSTQTGPGQFSSGRAAGRGLGAPQGGNLLGGTSGYGMGGGMGNAPAGGDWQGQLDQWMQADIPSMYQNPEKFQAWITQLGPILESLGPTPFSKYMDGGR